VSVGLFAAVGLGGLVGAPSRYLLDRAVSRRHKSSLPWGTMVINVSGSLLLGFLIGLSLAGHLPALSKALFATGFCGAYTTFSTFSFETIRLVEEDKWRAALVYVGLSVALGLAAAGVGLAAGRAF
jgi:CrcB protein